MKFEGLPGIDEYLSSKGSGCPISVKELSHISESLIAYCGFTKEQSDRLISLFFQEIRTALLNSEIIDIRSLGTFLISSPLTTLNTKRVFIKFKPKKSLINRLTNGK